MKLTPEQIDTFDEQGYVFFPNCFSEDEVAVLRSEADAILRTNRQEVWREKTGAPRTAFAAHVRRRRLAMAPGLRHLGAR